LEAPESLKLLEAFISKTGWPRPRFHRLLVAFEQNIWVKGLHNHPDWTPADVEATSLLTSDWTTLRDELQTCFERGLFQSPDSVDPHAAKGGWTLFPLFMNRAVYDDNLADCPSVTQCFEQLRKAVPIAGMWASMMTAGTELPLHQHHENTRLRAHLTLEVGEDCALEIEDDVRPFVQGEILMLEPCLEHRAWNRDPNGRSRMVLSVDFWHPLLSLHEVAALQFVERKLEK